MMKHRMTVSNIDSFWGFGVCMLITCLVIVIVTITSSPAVCSESQANLLQVTTQKCLDSCPTWCKDGEHVLIVSDRLGGLGIWKVPIKGGAAVQITSVDEGTVDLWPDLNFKSGEVVFASNRAGKVSQIFTVRAWKPGATQLTYLPFDATNPRWSPDGRTITFCCPDKSGTSFIWTMNMDGTGLCQLTEGHQPCWSPDGRKLAFTKLSSIGEDKNWDIYTVLIDGTGVSQITSEESNEIQPDWSPDGRWLSYVSIKDKISLPNKLSDWVGWLKSHRKYEIWMKNIEESSPSAVQITSFSGINIQPRWSPTGEQIAFASDRAGSLDIWCTYGKLPIGSDSVTNTQTK